MSKDQYITALKHFIVRVQTQTGQRIKRIRGDGAKEFDSGSAKKILAENGTKFESSAAYAHEQNGKAERMNCTVIEMGRTNMIQSGLPEKFWAEAIRTAIYIRNRLPTNAPRSIPLRIPYTSLDLQGNETRLNLSHMKPFGCAAYMSIPPPKRQKYLSQERAERGIFLGYSDDAGHLYRIWDIQNRVVIVARDVTFDERQFPTKSMDEEDYGDISEKDSEYEDPEHQSEIAELRDSDNDIWDTIPDPNNLILTLP